MLYGELQQAGANLFAYSISSVPIFQKNKIQLYVPFLLWSFFFFSFQKSYALKILLLYFGIFIHKDSFTNDTLFTKISLKSVIPVFEISTSSLGNL